MKRLYLLRHAPALSREEWHGADALRPLSDDGHEVARAVAARISALDLGLDALITSPYERALRTAVAVSDALGGDPPLVGDDRLQPQRFTLASLAAIIGDLGDVRAVMLIGHEPSMGATLAELVGGGAYALRKGGLARADVGTVAPGAGVLKWFVPPRLLR